MLRVSTFSSRVMPSSNRAIQTPHRISQDVVNFSGSQKPLETERVADVITQALRDGFRQAISGENLEGVLALVKAHPGALTADSKESWLDLFFLTQSFSMTMPKQAEWVQAIFNAQQAAGATDEQLAQSSFPSLAMSYVSRVGMLVPETLGFLLPFCPDLNQPDVKKYGANNGTLWQKVFLKCVSAMPYQPSKKLSPSEIKEQQEKYAAAKACLDLVAQAHRDRVAAAQPEQALNIHQLLPNRLPPLHHAIKCQAPTGLVQELIQQYGVSPDDPYCDIAGTLAVDLPGKGISPLMMCFLESSRQNSSLEYCQSLVKMLLQHGAALDYDSFKLLAIASPRAKVSQALLKWMIEDTNYFETLFQPDRLTVCRDVVKLVADLDNKDVMGQLLAVAEKKHKLGKLSVEELLTFFSTRALFLLKSFPTVVEPWLKMVSSSQEEMLWPWHQARVELLLKEKAFTQTDEALSQFELEAVLTQFPRRLIRQLTEGCPQFSQRVLSFYIPQLKAQQLSMEDERFALNLMDLNLSQQYISNSLQSIGDLKSALLPSHDLEVLRNRINYPALLIAGLLQSSQSLEQYKAILSGLDAKEQKWVYQQGIWLLAQRLDPLVVEGLKILLPILKKVVVTPNLFQCSQDLEEPQQKTFFFSNLKELEVWQVINEASFDTIQRSVTPKLVSDQQARPKALYQKTVQLLKDGVNWLMLRASQILGFELAKEKPSWMTPTNQPDGTLLNGLEESRASLVNQSDLNVQQVIPQGLVQKVLDIDLLNAVKQSDSQKSLKDAQQLVACGADVNTTIIAGESVLWEALTSGNEPLVEWLLTKNAQLTEPFQILMGKSLSAEAFFSVLWEDESFSSQSIEKNIETFMRRLKYLHSAGVNLNRFPSLWTTVIQSLNLSPVSLKKVMQRLIELEVDVNQLDAEGDLPLAKMLNCFSFFDNNSQQVKLQKESLVKFLIQYGAKVTEPDLSGQSVYERFLVSKHPLKNVFSDDLKATLFAHAKQENPEQVAAKEQVEIRNSDFWTLQSTPTQSMIPGTKIPLADWEKYLLPPLE